MTENVGDGIRAESERIERESESPDEPRPRFVRSKRAAVDPSQVYSIRIPVERIEDVRRLAASRHQAPTVMLRQWIIERIEAESEAQPPRLMPTATYARTSSSRALYVVPSIDASTKQRKSLTKPLSNSESKVEIQRIRAAG
jgi:hypothetical protein